VSSTRGTARTCRCSGCTTTPGSSTSCTTSANSRNIPVRAYKKGPPCMAEQSPIGSAIELVDVVKEYVSHGEVVQAVKGVTLDIAEGEFFSLLGPSGCGKTTTMRMIAGFEEPSKGVVRLHGRDVTDVPPNKRDVNMGFQSYALFPHMSVWDNVAFGLKQKKTPQDELKRRVGEMLEIVDLTGREKRRPRELS